MWHIFYEIITNTLILRSITNVLRYDQRMLMDVEVCGIIKKTLQRIEVNRFSYISFNFETIILVYCEFDIETSLGDHLFTIYGVFSLKYDQSH
jgi:hypothetical protein